MNVLDLLNETSVLTEKVAGTGGGEYAGPCPGCGGTDRFRIWPTQNNGDGSWWCRGCNTGGDNIQFCRDYLDMDFHPACEKCGRDPGERPARRPFAPPPVKPAWAPRPVNVPEGDLVVWREHAGKFVDWSHRQLLTNQDVLDYLDQRGVSGTAVKRWCLGWNPGENGRPCIYRARKGWGLPEEMGKNGRLKSIWLPRGIVIPWWDTDDRLQKIRIRRHSADMPPGAKNKYIVIKGSTVVHTAIYTNQPAAVVFETELDALAVADTVGDLVGVLALGTSGAKPQPQDIAFFKRCQVILVALDFDRAGKSAWKWWQANFSNARRWPCMASKDVGEMFEAGQDVRRWIMAGLPEAVAMRRLAVESLHRKGGDDVPATADVPVDAELSVESSQPAAKPANHADSADGLADLPADDVQRVGALLCQFSPVYIEKYQEHRVHETCGLVITYDGVRVVEPESYQDQPSLTRELCNLIFLGQGVLQHILDHPVERVNGDNFFF